MVRIPVKVVGSLAALTVIYPYLGQIAPEVRLETTTIEGSFAAARVFLPNGSDLVLFSRKAGESRSWCGMRTDAEVATLRLDDSGNPISSYRFGGTSLHYHGKPVSP